MKLPATLGGIGPREGETAQQHVRRLTRKTVAPMWGINVLGGYVVRLLDRVEALERRVAELEAERAR